MTLAVVLFIPTVPRLVDKVVGRRGREHWQGYRDFNAELVDELLRLPVWLRSGDRSPGS